MTTRQFQLRLTDEQTTGLRDLADAEGVSMHTVAVSAIEDRLRRRAQVVEILDQIDRDHAEVLERLADR